MFARFTKAGLALALVATALLSGVTSAEAAPVTVLSCYGSAKPINGTDPNGHWPPYGSTYTTANCNDINVKMTQDVDVQTCFAPSSGGYYCNGWRRVYANTWGLAATDVRDGTRFWLLFSSTSVQGLAAY